MKKLFFLLLITLSISQIGHSQNLNIEKLDAYFSKLEKNEKFMGSVALLREGKIIYTKQIGYSDIINNIKPNNKTKYRIGSISKTFTATLILKAVEEGKLSLINTLNQYFPTIENSEKISIENLLNHRSGIHNFTNDAEYLEYHSKAKNKNELLAIIKKGGSDFEPNSKSEYSNSNYVLLSYILEDIYGKSYSEILNENIIIPTNLNDTYFGGKINIKNNECYSYRYLDGRWNKETETDMSIPIGAGGIVSTPSDLVLFAEALFTNKIIAEESVKKMKTLKDNYGIGLFKIPFYNKISYGHTGGIDGFTSVFSYFPNEKYAFALTSNGTNYENNNISIVLLSSIFNKPFDIPTFKTYDVKPKDLDNYLGIYSSKEFPLKITITKSGKTLIAQATGQSSFDLEATEKDEFKFEQAGIVLEFDPIKNQMTLKQGGGVFLLTKE